MASKIEKNEWPLKMEKKRMASKIKKNEWYFKMEKNEWPFKMEKTNGLKNREKRIAS